MSKKTAFPVRQLCITGLLIALSVVVGIICKTLLTVAGWYRITFENFPIILAGYCFGPIYGMAAGIIADLVSCLCAGQSPIPFITVGAAAVGLCAGLAPMLFRGKNRKAGRTALLFSELTAHLFGQVILKSVAKIIVMGMPWWGAFIGLGISCAVAPLEFLLLLVLLRNPEIKKTLRGMVSYEL